MNTTNRAQSGYRWRVILIATGFNLLFEYSVRGINDLVARPVLPLLLFAVYFTYFTMLEDLIVRHRLKDYHLVIAAFFFGIIAQFLISGAPLNAQRLLGVNWGRFLYINLAWWAALQGVMTFYLANRVGRRNWGHAQLSKTGWGISLILMLGIILLFQAGRASFAAASTAPTRPGVMLILLILTGILFFVVLRRTRPSRKEAASRHFHPDRFMDLLSLLTVIVFFVCAVFIAPNVTQAGASAVNAPALRIVSLWTLLLAILMLGYRLIWKQEIPI